VGQNFGAGILKPISGNRLRGFNPFRCPKNNDGVPARLFLFFAIFAALFSREAAKNAKKVRGKWLARNPGLRFRI
jgi:hypothetical protein